MTPSVGIDQGQAAAPAEEPGHGERSAFPPWSQWPSPPESGIPRCPAQGRSVVPRGVQHVGVRGNDIPVQAALDAAKAVGWTQDYRRMCA